MRIGVGWIVHVCFDDHCEDGEQPIRFDVWGRVAKVTRKYVVIVCWGYDDASMDLNDDSNIKRYTILRSAIVSIRKLRAG